MNLRDRLRRTYERWTDRDRSRRELEEARAELRRESRKAYETWRNIFLYAELVFNRCLDKLIALFLGK